MILKTSSLNPMQRAIILDKQTEAPFSQAHNDSQQLGTYLCRRCGLALFRSHHAFHSGCGWPSFDDSLASSLKEQVDLDGQRTELLCARCEGHLGHVFKGEGFTPRNLRHCINALSLDFVADPQVLDTEEAVFAAGCFWGVEYYFQRLAGVLKTEVGYMGGHTLEPSYQAVCQGHTGHVEAIRVLYDPTRLDYEALAKYFFEIHDPSQADGQGPDRGPQYLSVGFYYNDAQLQILQRLVAELRQLGLSISTQLKPISTFWPAERYHQNYYAIRGQAPYCHHYQKRWP